MSGVVLRCPNCGTAQGAGGECEACHEGEVRYFCTNHAPGLWLAGSACPTCHARFGDPAPLAEPRRSTADATAVAPPAPRRRPARIEPERGPWSPDEASGELGRPEYRGRVPNPWLDLLASAARASMARRTAPRDEDVLVRRRGGGCLGRLFLLLILAIGFFVIVPLLLGGSLLGLF